MPGCGDAGAAIPGDADAAIAGDFGWQFWPDVSA
jgi:hypothetical protein